MNTSEDKCKLKLLGITYNQIESGVYALILQEEEGEQRHIPIVIGFAEAQSIEVKLQEVVTPRPLTHDLIVNMFKQFGMTLSEVNIYRIPSGAFAAEITIISNDGQTHRVDARSSDGIALAIRVDAPIYASRQMIDEVGFVPGNKPIRNLQSRVASAAQTKPRKSGAPTYSSTIEVAPFDTMSVDELQKNMMQAAENENYELAARLKEEIDRRNHNDDIPDTSATTPQDSDKTEI